MSAASEASATSSGMSSEAIVLPAVGGTFVVGNVLTSLFNGIGANGRETSAGWVGAGYTVASLSMVAGSITFAVGIDGESPALLGSAGIIVGSAGVAFAMATWADAHVPATRSERAGITVRPVLGPGVLGLQGTF